MAFTEFCCRSGGSNMNGGSLSTSAEPATTPVYSATNGGWNSGTGVFTPTSGNPSLTVTAGDYASVFLDGATTPVCICRVSSVNSTTITLSTSIKAGTAPTTSGTGISINVGGAWKGPNGTDGFPLNATIVNMNNLAATASLPTRINLKNDATYAITAQMTCSINTSTIIIQGYTSAFGDLGKAIIDGGTSGASYVLLTVNNPDIHVYDVIFQNNGATGSAAGFARNGRGHSVRCVVHDVRGDGFFAPFGDTHLYAECEAYACNQSNTANNGGFHLDASGMLFRCIGHDNTGGNNNGFVTGGNPVQAINSIFESNGSAGMRVPAAVNIMVTGCDFYNNGSDGLLFAGNVTSYVENNNFVKNGGWGVNYSSTTARQALLQNNRFGAGTQANTSGDVNPGGNVVQVNSAFYASNVTPWVDPANGDFRINLAAAKDAGRGNFTQTAASYAGTVGYPDIGAAQHQDTGGASGPVGQLKIFRGGTPY